MIEEEVEIDSGKKSDVPIEHLIPADGNIREIKYGSIVYEVEEERPTLKP